MNNIDLEKLRRAVPIVDLAKQLGIEVRGTQARCFNAVAHKHSDHNPSLGFDLKTNRFKCFACGVSGSVIDLYMGVRGVDFKTAVSELGGKPITPRVATIQGDISTTPITARTGSDFSDVYETLAQPCDFVGLSDEAISYLTGTKRGLDIEVINYFGLFTISDHAKAETRMLEAFSMDKLKASGLFNDNGHLIFNRHVIIPFKDKDKIVYMQGRALEGEPKYLNLRGIKKPIFNVDLLEGLADNERVYMCEGVFDAIILAQYGYNSVAILGVTDFEARDIDLFKRFDVILALDNDESGRTMSGKIADAFLSKGKRVSVKMLPDGVKDITEYYLRP